MNNQFMYWFDRSGLSKKECARRVARHAQSRGLTHVQTAASRVRGWIAGEQPVELEVAESVAEVLSEACGEPLTLEDLDFHVPHPAKDPALPSATTDLVGTLDRHCRTDLMLGSRDVRAEYLNVTSGEKLLDAVEHTALGRPTVLSVTPDVAGGIGPHHVAQVEGASAIFRRWDNEHGGGLRRKAVIGQLSELVPLLEGPFVDERIGRALFIAVADLAQLAGWMSFDLALDTTAQRYYLLALQLAKNAGDRLQVARMLYCLARQMIELDRPQDALDLAQTALYATRRTRTPRVTAMLRILEARAHACMADAVECPRALGAAEEAFSHAGAGTDPGWAQFFNDAELAGVTGVAFRDLAIHDPDQTHTHAAKARPWIQSAAGGRSPGFLRSRVLDLTSLALVDLFLGEPETAAHSAARALDLATSVSSTRVARNLRHVNTLSQQRHSHVPAIRDLNERVYVALPH